jgi:hypothetical protein
MYPITYIAERIPEPMGGQNYEELMFDILDLLAATKEISYFRCGYIQRLIDYQWQGNLRHAYIIMSSLYAVSFMLIVACALSLSWDLEYHEVYASYRNIANVINLVIVVTSVCTFEVRQLCEEGWDYFKSFYNISDLSFVIFTIIVLVLNYLDQPKFWVSAEDVTDPVYRMLKPKGSSVTDEAAITATGIDLHDHTLLVQCVRCAYSFLVLFAFIKMLQLAQFFDQVAFLVKMIGGIMGKSVPFLFFFLTVVVTFSLTLSCLDVVFSDPKLAKNE